MISSNEKHREYSLWNEESRPNFALVVAFDYYDGPEQGMAINTSGAGIRFSSLGNSKSRLFRAFECIAIEGNWWPHIKALQQVEKVNSEHQILVPSLHSKALIQLENDVLHAQILGRFVAVGTPSLKNLQVEAVTLQELEDLKKFGGSSMGFEIVHRLVKTRSRIHSPSKNVRERRPLF